MNQCVVTLVSAWSLLLAQAALAQENPAPANQTLEISSWWVSPGEAASLAVIRRHAEAAGLRWQQRLTPGSGSTRYSDALQTWVAEGRAPVAAHIIGYDIQDWASQGRLATLDAVARDGEWDEVIPFGIQAISKYQGHWVAVPINAHSTNWLYLNAALVRQLGASAPDSWPDFIAMLIKAREAGILPIAIGREPWEHTLLFESVVAATAGAEFYRKAFLELDPSTLDGPLIEEVFARMRLLRTFVDEGFARRTWDEASDLVRKGKALVQIQGSWVPGEFAFHGLDPGKDYECWRFPDTQGMFLFNADQYIFFKDAPVDESLRNHFAKVLMQPELQTELNLATGAAPARVDVSRKPFNSCTQQNISDMRRSNLQRTLMGSIAMGNANPPGVKNAIYQVVSRHFVGQMGDVEAAKLLRQVIREAR